MAKTAMGVRWSSSRQFGPPIGARASGEGLLQGHPPQRAARQRPTTEVIERGRDRCFGGRGRHHRLCPAVRRADVQRRSQRLAAGRAAGRNARPRPSIGSAGRHSRRSTSAAALIASGVHGRRESAPAVEHMGHIPDGASAFKWVDDVGSPWPPELLEHYKPRAPGHLGRDDRRPVGNPPASELDEIGVRFAPASLTRPRRRAGSRREIVPFGVNGRHLRDRPGHPPGLETSTRSSPAQAGLQGGRQDHRGQLLADLGRRGRRCC